ncbi:DUF4271 domain-containing protein [Flavobacterium sasangense]|uniref:DUF4271 domain-containing protein n=1 Tax=Flavobacterium sasangense TaxID=503361 RepID=UPI00047D0376|nr:DUF4271 domain-containing protein [Flavobacterium sasangense]
MLAIQLHDRIIESKDWATILFIICVAIIAINKTISSVRFNEFVRLAYSDKYTKIYRDSSNLMSGFTISMFVLQLISFSFFTLLVLNQFNRAEKTDFIIYIQIFTFLSVFILSKFLIEKIIATAFKIEEFNEQFNLLKVNYRAYFGFILLPVNIILFYNSFDSDWFFWTLLITLITINITTYLVALKLYQNLLLRKIFYFILYLCTLEIAPYYFIYNWFTKN